LIQNDFAGAAAVLGSLNSQTLLPELDWQRAYWLYQVKLAAGDTDAALAVTTNLVQIARLEKSGVLRAESVALRAGVLEQLGRKAEALAVYQDNLTNAPEERTRQAILKIAELSVALGRFSDAEESLQKFPAQFPNSPAADLAWLTLGELQLKDYVTQPAATNQLSAALERFDQFLRVFKNSPLTGKAYLDRGWCGWCAWLAGSTTNSLTDSLTDFAAAAQKLPPSEDLAVARFKKGDALFAQKNYAGALENYHAVIDDFTNFPAVGRSLGDQALYQSLRASLELKDVAGASNVMTRILELHPAGDLNGASLLLVGEGLSPAAARALFEQFQQQVPDSLLRPQVELAIARTYEQEQNWPAAIGKYSGWLNDFPTNALRPQADYALALADFRAGNETNAFVRFTNFVAQFPTNDLAPLALWWVADHFFRAGDFVDAEKNFQLFFQNFPTNDLVYQARMMAGRAAMGRLSYSDAIRYFTNLTSDANCPLDLNAKALFAYGSALMQGGATDTNSPSANFERATSVFSRICQLYPTNELGALAWGEIGDCALQLAAYDQATNAYAQVIASPFANISARSQAQIGFGIVLEKKAALATGVDQTNLLQMALDNYLKVFDTWTGNNLRDGEVADEFWVKKAGLQALPLIQMLGAGDPDKFIDQMEKLFPQSKDSLEKKRAALSPAKN
jgi:tetratricopeptide (TPR) repeat protein